MNKVTGIMVTHNTKYLAKNAFDSVRRFHPDMKIIIVDGSDQKDPCCAYTFFLMDEKTRTHNFGVNIGHGRGMDFGIRQCQTEYALFFDSDIEMIKSPVKEMLDMMDPDTYGVGLIEHTGLDGYEYGYYPYHKDEPSMAYLHPFFALIRVESYFKFKPFVHHGAPCYLAMRDIFNQGLSDKILKSFPGLHHTAGEGLNWKAAPSPYVQHGTSGTRKARTDKGQPAIEGNWVL